MRPVAGQRGGQSTAWIVLVIALVTGACEGTPSDPSSPPPNLVVVTGVVTGDGQPLANTYVEVRTSHSLTTFLALRTDATGRYRAEFRSTKPFSTLMVGVIAVHDTYPFQPCAAWHEESSRRSGERTVDVALTAARRDERAGSASGAGRRNVTGTVYRIGPTGKQPVADVSVQLGGPIDGWRAWTATDDAGRFSLCELPANRQLPAMALQDEVRQPLVAYGSVPPGGDAEIELILEPER